MFLQINTKFFENFRSYLLTAKGGSNKQKLISQNTASTYFSFFKAALKQAFIDGYFTTDILAKIKSIYLLGTEKTGLSEEAKNNCHFLVQLPGKLSLNVSVAGSLAIYDRLMKTTF